TKFLAYGVASAVTIGRVTGKQHFSSDAWIGSALGWYFGRQVYRAHHEAELGGAPWDSEETLVAEKERNPAYMASGYVTVGSWIYPALERMVAQGYVHNAFLGMRPWTRMQCAQMVQEAESDARYQSGEEEASAAVIHSLHDEFASELLRMEGLIANRGVSLD